MAMSSSAMGKAAGEGYIPVQLPGDPVPPPHPPAATTTTTGGFSGRQEKNQHPTSETPLMRVCFFSPKIIPRRSNPRWKPRLEGDVPRRSQSIALDFVPACN